MTWDHMSSSGHHVRCKWKNDGKRFHFSGSAERFMRMGSAPMGEGVRGRGAGLIMARASGLLFTIPAFLRMIGSWGCLITRKNAGILALALHESQMGGLNHT